jgi:hypothetical protein
MVVVAVAEAKSEPGLENIFLFLTAKSKNKNFLCQSISQIYKTSCMWYISENVWCRTL